MRRIVFALAFACVFLSVVASASAEAPSPWWHVTSGSRPGNLSSAEPRAEVNATIENVGDGDVEARTTPVVVTDTLPAGLKATKVIGYVPFTFVANSIPCELQGERRVVCTFSGSGNQYKYGEDALPPFFYIEVRVFVTVEKTAKSGELNEVSVVGGGAPSVSAARPITVSSEPTRFGIESWEMLPEEVGGRLDSQAGSHPFQTTFTVQMNQGEVTPPSPEEALTPEVKAVGSLKDLHFNLPVGFVGNPTPLPQCPISKFYKRLRYNIGVSCPAETAVGVAMVMVNIGDNYYEKPSPLYNVEPARGEPARFGFFINEGSDFILIDTAVRTGSDYGITASVNDISQVAGLLLSSVTFWGVPRDPSHNNQRGNACVREEYEEQYQGCSSPEVQEPPPFLTMPTSCTGPLQSSAEADTWEQEGVFATALVQPMEAMSGCNRLPFVPEIRVTPDGQAASTPTGLNVDVHVPQEGQLNPAGLAQSSVKNIKVVLPEGVAINPSGGDGLQACSESQIGYLPGESHPPDEQRFTPKLPGSFGSTEPFEPGVNFCPNAAKIATVKIKTPLLPNPLEGAVYLASPQNFAGPLQENPFETLVAQYIVAEDPVSGSLVKLPGKVTLNPVSGQIESTFEDNPQLPFEDAELHFFGGERAPLATPARCGTYTTNATYEPWAGGEPVHSSSSFQVTSGPNGQPCPGASLPFTPSLSSGTTNINSGSYSELPTTLNREDGEQTISAVTLHYPPGLSGLLKGVTLCGEQQANEGTCGPESQIGETVVSVGLGGDPYTVRGGKVYITGPYEGAPFGLSIVNPAKAGPFDLQEGRPVVVRAKVEVDPHTAALTVTTDPPGSPHAIPTMIEGIPLEIRHVNVLVNRTDFTFNPTNCEPMEVKGTIYSAEGAAFPVSNPFQVTNCAALKFAPKFAVSTSGKTSKADGASLSVQLSYPTAPGQANIKQVKVELPKDLPSRLTTLQKACTSAQFDANPAGCPAASVVGHAKALTPLLPVPLEGPAYFVSNGREAFPNLIIVLQGYGVTIDLVGDTFINKQGVTSSTFKTVPDEPVGSFELTLPEGQYSALAANGNLCKEKLAMPTEFVAQNGAEIHESTKIAVTGCGKAKKAKHKKTSHKKKHAKKAKKRR